MPKTEETWKGSIGEWRRPDVQAKFGDLRMAFEIQLSTTYIRVIAERQEFYLREGEGCWSGCSTLSRLV
ncbi:DUF6035 family protein [Extensimonas sp. H3M7-6]|uniref:DUF6035 family protein n=1 Tax=Extensimonas soli TaxID=3031322 RepID=UPI00387E7CA9